MALTETGYRPRLIDKTISEALQVFGAVSVEGPKFCGKTWTALNHANSVTYIGDPAGGFANRQRAELDPSLVLDGDEPHLIDEWQDVPGIWDAVRFAVDRSSQKGRFILAGSTMPPRNGRQHSGAGRIDAVHMRTMTSFEQGYSDGSLSLAAFAQHKDVQRKNSSTTLDGLIDRIVRGGWPENLDLPTRLAMRIPGSYLSRLVTEDMVRLDNVLRDSAKVRATINSLARNTSTLVKVSTILQDIATDNQSISRETTAEYLSALKRLYILEEIPAWSPNFCSRRRLRQSPKRLLTDPSLAIAALGLTPDKLKADLFTLGFMFEALCLRDLLVYCSVNDASLYHYADDSGLDADAVIELPNGSWLAVEIKLGHHQVDEAAKKLLRLQGKMTKNGLRPAEGLLVLTGLSSFLHRRDDGVVEVPLDCLGP
jgi:predicted AAA+ superfamily ATPase